MNTMQRLVLLVGILVVIGMGIYPPWEARRASWGYDLNRPGPPVVFSRPVGYSLITSPPVREGVIVSVINVDIGRLMAQEAIVVVATAMGVLLFKGWKPKGQMSGAASQGAQRQQNGAAGLFDSPEL